MKKKKNAKYKFYYKMYNEIYKKFYPNRFLY